MPLTEEQIQDLDKVSGIDNNSLKNQQQKLSPRMQRLQNIVDEQEGQIYQNTNTQINYSEIIFAGVLIIIILFLGFIIYKLGRLTPKIYRKFERWLDK